MITRINPYPPVTSLFCPYRTFLALDYHQCWNKFFYNCVLFPDYSVHITSERSLSFRNFNFRTATLPIT